MRGGQNFAGLLVFITDVHALGLEKAQGLIFTESFYWDANDRTRAFAKRSPHFNLQCSDSRRRCGLDRQGQRSRSHEPIAVGRPEHRTAFDHSPLDEERDERSDTQRHIAFRTNNPFHERIVEKGCGRALVFEDDVVDLHVPDEMVREILAAVPADAEVIQWGWNGGRFRPSLGVLQQALSHVKYAFGRMKFNHTRIRNSYMRRYNDHFHVASTNFLAHAYTITGDAARKFIAYNTPIRMNADHVLLHAILDELVRGYVPITQLFGQRSIDPGDEMESMTQKYY